MVAYGAPDLGRGGRPIIFPFDPNKRIGWCEVMGGRRLSLAAQRAPIPPPIPPGSKAAGAALRSIRGTAGRRTAERIILYVFLAALRAGDREKFIMPFFTGLLSLSAWLGWVGELGKLRVDPVICNLAQHKPHQDCPTRPGSLLVPLPQAAYQKSSQNTWCSSQCSAAA